MPSGKPSSVANALLLVLYYRPCWDGYHRSIVTVGHHTFSLPLSSPHCCSHTIGTSSSGHSNWNHSLPQKAPQPHLPDPSDVTVTSQLILPASYMIDTPFHRSTKRNHHSMSDLVSLLRQMKWSGGNLSCMATASSSISRNTSVVNGPLVLPESIARISS